MLSRPVAFPKDANKSADLQILFTETRIKLGKKHTHLAHYLADTTEQATTSMAKIEVEPGVDAAKDKGQSQYPNLNIPTLHQALSHLLQDNLSAANPGPAKFPLTAANAKHEPRSYDTPTHSELLYVLQKLVHPTKFPV